MTTPNPKSTLKQMSTISTDTVNTHTVNTHTVNTDTVSTGTVNPDHFIDGKRVASASRFDDISPRDGTVIARLARGGKAEVDLAVAAAKRAFPAWSATTKEERAATLHRIADACERNIAILADIETRDNGALLRSHIRGVMPRVAHNFRFFADFLLTELGHPDFYTRGHNNHVSWNPAGVCALISPWNAPLMLATWKIAPALAAGNTVVLKPSEWSPLTASLFAELTLEAGLAPGVFNVVQGYGDEAGEALVSHPDVSRISFTGSVATAKKIAANAAKNLTPVSLELGGKSPFIVFADADLDLAVAQAVEQYDNAGQVCLSGTRLYVENSIKDEFVSRFLEKARQLVQGDPVDEKTDIGPQIHEKHFAKISGFVERAREEGAEILLGGGANTELGGLYYRPTLVTGVSESSEISTQEIFGPVLVIHGFDTEEEAVEKANASEFGLAAMLFTGDTERARRVGEQLIAGTVWTNCFFVRDLRAPFGGARQSGVGREGGTWSFDFFCDIKNTVTAPHGWK